MLSPRPQLTPKASRSNLILDRLTLESTLIELPLFSQHLDASCLVKELVQLLDSEPLLPGVIIFDQGTFIGMVSRRRFLEELSRPYALDLFLKRPLKIMCHFLFTDFLVFPSHALIVAVAGQALERSPEQHYDPVLVQTAEDEYRLLDMHQLLVAQSRIHELAQQVIKEQTQAQMLQSEKMASLGRIIANVAHEILNPVNFISGNLNYLSNYTQDLLRLLSAFDEVLPEPKAEIDYLKEEIESDFIVQDMPQLIDSMQMGAERLKMIASSLRNFSHMDEAERKPIDLHQCIDNTLLILNNRLKTGIDVIKNYGDLPPVTCYSGQIGQVVMNIVSNAIDALQEKVATLRQVSSASQSGGAIAMTKSPWQPKITIETNLTDPPQGQTVDTVSEMFKSDLSGDRPPDQWVSIVIQDNGPGIPADIQDKIFEDFFTTKPVGKGTGLGLAICYQIIVERHRGTLTLDSDVGIGTKFAIHLPIH